MATKPFAIQIAIQGGGAKICSLIAAMDAVQELEREGVVKVTRVAGTSAGAIVGCLFAADIPMEVVKVRLQSFNPPQLSQMFPAPGLKNLTRLSFGKPLWKPDALAKELDRFFGQRAKVFTLGDLRAKKNVDVYVVAADLTESRKLVHHDPSKKIVEALLDSCGLPYCFRTWSKSGSAVVVDGGICENLPSDELVGFEDKDGPTIGFSFDPVRGRAPSSFKDFSIALLDTAMSNSMSRARQRLGTDRVFSIATNIGTFDFGKAIDEGLGVQYDLVKQQAAKFLREFVSSKLAKIGKISGDAWQEQNMTMMKSLGEVYRIQHEPSKLKYLECSLVVQGNSIGGDHKQPDYVWNVMKFATLNDPIYCHAISLTESDNPAAGDTAEFSVLEETTKTSIDIRSMPIRDSVVPTRRGLLLSFLPVLKKNSGPYALTITDASQDFLKPLIESRIDELVIAPLRATGLIDRMDLVLLWPKGAGQVSMVPKDGTVLGKKMTSLELRDYSRPAGFDIIGWRGENIPAGQEFGVNLFFSSNNE